MTLIDKIADRYRNDNEFHALVDTIRFAVEGLHLSPSEVREAAMFAVYLTEARRPLMRADGMGFDSDPPWDSDGVARNVADMVRAVSAHKPKK